VSVKKLIVYQKAFDVSMEIFHMSQSFPVDEKFGLTSQIRRSSRSVCSNLAEAYRKRIYPAHFTAKISDADMENTETQTWLDFSLACNYIDESKFHHLYSYTIEIGKLLNHMLSYPERYLIKKQTINQTN
jgi:four helix bundle protein